MFGPILSVLLVGAIPVWGLQDGMLSLSRSMQVAPPLTAPLIERELLDARLSASGAMIVDLESGQTLFERSQDTARPMASLTKLMTALVIAENHSLDEIVTIPKHITEVVGTKAWLPPGERFTVGDLLSALLITSANDAAVTLAEYHSGSTEAFVSAMNTRAKVLGLLHTFYENPAGLDAPRQQSSPRDVVWLAMFVMRRPEIAQRMSTVTTEIKGLSGKILTLNHTHLLLHTDASADVFAGKTGTTDAAGQCLLSIVKTNGRTYITVLLHSKDRYADMRQVLAALSH